MFGSRFSRAAWMTIRQASVHSRIPRDIIVSTVRNIRPFSHVTFTFVDGQGDKTRVTATEGQSLLDVAHAHDVELEGACGGELACSTCHLVFEKRIFEELPDMSEEEQDMLDLAWGLTETSRLGCQIHVTKNMDDMTVQIPDDADNLM